jgi:hypothetical protein
VNLSPLIQTTFVFFSYFICDVMTSRALIKKDKTEMKSAMDREELDRLYQKLISKHDALLVKVARIEAEFAGESDPFEGTEKMNHFEKEVGPSIHYQKLAPEVESGDSHRQIRDVPGNRM